jgi:hypothetical protein
MALFGVLRRPTPVAQEPPLPAPAEPGPTSCPARQNLPFYQREPLPAGGKNAGSDLKIPVDKKSLNYKSLSISELQINKIFLASLVSELLRHRQTRAQANDSSSYP